MSGLRASKIQNNSEKFAGTCDSIVKKQLRKKATNTALKFYTVMQLSNFDKHS